MTTDDTITDDQNLESTTVTVADSETVTTTETTNVDFNQKLDEMFANFNDKIDSMTKDFQVKLDEANQKIKDKDDELAKLKNVNAQILMNTDFSKNGNGVIDFGTAEFDDVDWGKEANRYMGTVDSRIN